jgi:hypothetical protein
VVVKDSLTTKIDLKVALYKHALAIIAANAVVMGLLLRFVGH